MTDRNGPLNYQPRPPKGDVQEGRRAASMTESARIAKSVEHNGAAVAMLSRDVEDVSRDVREIRAEVDKMVSKIDALTAIVGNAKFAVTVLKTLGAVVAGIVAMWATLVHNGKMP